MNELLFPTPPKTHRKVKTVELRLSGRDGEEIRGEHTVFIYSAGTPSFVMGVPDEYVRAWTEHRSKEYNSTSHEGFALTRKPPFFVSASSFDSVVRAIEKLSHNYAQFVKSAAVEKVIAIEMSLKGEDVNFNTDTFPHRVTSDTAINLTYRLRWRVNGKVYRDMRWEDDKMEGVPAFNQLAHEYGDDKGIIIPHSDAAWATLQQIEDALTKAAKVLMELTDQTQCVALLTAGMKNLLASSKSVATGGQDAA